MNRTPMKATAISWVIACGLLCGGTGMLMAPPAAADSGTVGNSHGGRDGDSRSDSNDARPGAHRPGGPRKPRGPGIKPGTTRPDGGIVSGSRRHRGLPGGRWHPGLPGHHDWSHPGMPGYHDWPHGGWPFPHFPPIVLPPFPHWPRATTGDDGVGAPGAVARVPRAVLGRPPESVGGGGGGGARIDLRPRTIPPVEPGQPGEPPAISVDHAGVGVPSLEPPPITMPPLIALPPAVPAPMRPIGPGSEPGPRTGPGREPNPTRERPPATSSGAGTEMPPSTRVGYPRYLQEAKMGEVAALALPGFAGILALTALGGVVGYRQARAGHVLRTAGTTRFMQ